MKRWLVILLVLLALIVLVSPGIIGRIAERNMEKDIEWAESESPALHITTEAYQRGWFTSEGQHRIVLSGGQFREVAENYRDATGNPQLPSLLIDTRFDHGLVPVTSLSRDAGSLVPGLASTVSTFQFDPGNGEAIALPGTLYSDVSLAGASDSRLLLETGSFEDGDLQLDWQGADLTVYANRRSGKMTVHGEIEPWNVSTIGGKAAIGPVTIDADLVRSEFGFNTGPVTFNVGEMTFETEAQKFESGGVDINMDSNIDAGRVNSTATMTVQEVTVPGFGKVAMVMDTSMNRFDARSLGVIVKALRDAQSADDPELALQMLYPEIEADVQSLIAAGGEIRFDRLDVSLPQGTLETRIVLNVAEMDPGAGFSWPGVLLGMTADVDLKIPVTLFDLATTMNPQAGSLLAMGILRKDGDFYVMKAEYAKGLVNVNGAPMPLPIPAM